MKPPRLLPAALACLLAAGPLGQAPLRAADDDKAAHQAAAEDVLKAMHMDTTFSATSERMMTGVDRLIGSSVQKLGNKPEATEFQTRMHAQIHETLDKQFTWEGIKPTFIQSYVDSFTTQELKDLAAFYNSPVGQKLIAKQPEIAERTSRAGQEKVQQVLGPIIRMVQAEAAKLPGNAPAPGGMPGAGSFPVPPPPPASLGRPPAPPTLSAPPVPPMPPTQPAPPPSATGPVPAASSPAPQTTP